MKPVVALVLLGAFALFSVDVKRQVLRESEGGHLDSLPTGKAMPDFTLADSGGKQFTLSALTPKNKVVMVNFWGVWCGPCRVEMPGFEKMYAERAKSGFLILAIDEGDTPAELAAYLKKKPVSFPVLLDPDGALAKRFGVAAYPTTVLIGTDGKIFRVIEGVEPYLSAEIMSRLSPHQTIITNIDIGGGTPDPHP